jgi:hypothetical protein
MRYVCDAPGGKSWFRIETLAEAAQESDMMAHAVEKYFRQEWQKALDLYEPPPAASFEQEIGLKAHVHRIMPRFLTLRDGEGEGLATAMLPPDDDDTGDGRTIIVGPSNEDPYREHGDAIRALGEHLGLSLERSRCYPYRRG